MTTTGAKKTARRLNSKKDHTIRAHTSSKKESQQTVDSKATRSNLPSKFWSTLASFWSFWQNIWSQRVWRQRFWSVFWAVVGISVTDRKSVV